MRAVRELILPDWMTMAEAAEHLRISEQAAGRAALRHGFERRRFGKMVLISRAAVEQYRRTRQLSGPRKA